MALGQSILVFALLLAPMPAVALLLARKRIRARFARVMYTRRMTWFVLGYYTLLGAVVLSMVVIFKLSGRRSHLWFVAAALVAAAPGLSIWLWVQAGDIDRQPLDAGHCPECGYPMRHQRSGRCPECGEDAHVDHAGAESDSKV